MSYVTNDIWRSGWFQLYFIWVFNMGYCIIRKQCEIEYYKSISKCIKNSVFLIVHVFNTSES